MNKKIGFIGCGNMGSSMVGGLIKSGFLKADNIIVSTKTKESAKKLNDKFGIMTTLDSKVVAKEAEIIIFDGQSGSEKKNFDHNTVA